MRSQSRTPAPVRILFDGQSMNILPWPRGIPYFTQLALGIPYTITGYPGFGWAQLSASQKSRLVPYIRNRAGCTDILVLNGGQGDILGDFDPTAADAYERVKSYAANARSWGWENILICTWPDISPYVNASSPEKRAEFLVYNQIVRDNWEDDFDGICDLAVHFPDYADTTYYAEDGLHLNDLGASIGGSAMSEAINTLLSQLD